MLRVNGVRWDGGGNYSPDQSGEWCAVAGYSFERPVTGDIVQRVSVHAPIVRHRYHPIYDEIVARKVVGVSSTLCWGGLSVPVDVPRRPRLRSVTQALARASRDGLVADALRRLGAAAFDPERVRRVFAFLADRGAVEVAAFYPTASQLGTQSQRMAWDLGCLGAVLYTVPAAPAEWSASLLSGNVGELRFAAGSRSSGPCRDPVTVRWVLAESSKEFC